MQICNWLGVALLPISSEVQITIQGRVRPDSLVWCGVVWYCGNDPGLYGHWAARHFSWLLTWEQAPATGGQLSTIWLGRKGRTQLLPQRQWTLGWCSSHKASWHGILSTTICHLGHRRNVPRRGQTTDALGKQGGSRWIMWRHYSRNSYTYITKNMWSP